MAVDGYSLGTPTISINRIFLIIKRVDGVSYESSINNKNAVFNYENAQRKDSKEEFPLVIYKLPVHVWHKRLYNGFS